MSLEGTLVGVVAGGIVAAIAVWVRLRSLAGVANSIGYELRWFAILLFAAVAGSYLESILGSWNRRQERPLPNGALNFFNTACGAAIVLLIAPRLAKF